MVRSFEFMKYQRILVIGLVAASGSVFAAGQQTTSNPNTQDARTQRDANDRSQTRSFQGREATVNFSRAAFASDIKGMSVKNTSGDELGAVEDLVLDLQKGHVAYAVLASGGFLGIGEKLIAVPARKFKMSEDNKNLILDVTKEKLSGAPNFDRTAWPDLSDQSWMRIVDRYHGARTEYWKENDGQRIKDADPIMKNRLGFLRFETVKSEAVRSKDRQELGEVKDLVLDVPAGVILAAVVEPAKAKEKAVLVPPTLFEAGPSDKLLYLDTDRERLAGAPQAPEKADAANEADLVAASFRHFGKSMPFSASRQVRGADQDQSQERGQRERQSGAPTKEDR